MQKPKMLSLEAVSGLSQTDVKCSHGNQSTFIFRFRLSISDFHQMFIDIIAASIGILKRKLSKIHPYSSLKVNSVSITV